MSQNDSAKTAYFLYAWTKEAPKVIPDIIMRKYPTIIQHQNYDNLSEIFLFAKRKNENAKTYGVPDFFFHNDFENHETWGASDENLDTTIYYEGSWSYRIDSTMEFGPTFVFSSEKLSSRSLQSIKAKVLSNYRTDAKLVISVLDTKDNPKEWVSSDISNFVTPDIGMMSLHFLKLKIGLEKVIN